MNIILCGYNWAGCMALKLLQEDNHNIFVYTHENPYHIPSLINQCEEKQVGFTTEKINITNLPFQPDIICSIYYRYIIPESVIRSSSKGGFNLHPALLPRYSGCSSLTWAMVNGETEVGYTFHYLDSSVDTGKIIIQKALPVEEFDTQETLYNRAMFESMKDFRNVIDLVVNGYEGKDQSGERLHYKRGCPYNGLIDNKWEDDFVKRFIRAMIYPPYPPAKFNGTDIFTMQDYKDMKKQP